MITRGSIRFIGLLLITVVAFGCSDDDSGSSGSGGSAGGGSGSGGSAGGGSGTGGSAGGGAGDSGTAGGGAEACLAAAEAASTNFAAFSDECKTCWCEVEACQEMVTTVDNGGWAAAACVVSQCPIADQAERTMCIGEKCADEYAAGMTLGNLACAMGVCTATCAADYAPLYTAPEDDGGV